MPSLSAIARTRAPSPSHPNAPSLAPVTTAPPSCRFEGGLYDRVLLDAPCSSERHVVAAALEAGGVVSSSSWSREQCANLAALQLKVREAHGQPAVDKK